MFLNIIILVLSLFTVFSAFGSINDDLVHAAHDINYSALILLSVGPIVLIIILITRGTIKNRS
ncbi:MAG: hypothetical protein ACKE51_08890 [Methylococcaceae bacterium]